MANITKKSRTGRLQLWTRRALIYAGHPLTTTQLVHFCFPGVALNRRHWLSVRNAAGRFAVAVGRRRRRGLPILWTLKPWP